MTLTPVNTNTITLDLDRYDADEIANALVAYAEKWYHQPYRKLRLKELARVFANA